MKETTNVENRVLQILQACPASRYDDMLLILHYYKQYSHMPVDKMSFADIILTYKAFDLPCFETIERARRRVQSLFPEVSRDPVYREKAADEEADRKTVVMVMEIA